jgi:hypothetical protein
MKMAHVARIGLPIIYCHATHPHNSSKVDP